MYRKIQQKNHCLNPRIPYEGGGCPVISNFNLLLLMYVRIKYAVYFDNSGGGEDEN